MSLKYNNSANLNEIKFNGEDVKYVKFNNTLVWAKPFKCIVKLNDWSGVQSCTWTRTCLDPAVTDNSGSFTSDGFIYAYNGDTITFTITTNTGYHWAFTDVDNDSLNNKTSWSDIIEISSEVNAPLPSIFKNHYLVSVSGVDKDPEANEGHIGGVDLSTNPNYTDVGNILSKDKYFNYNDVVYPFYKTRDNGFTEAPGTLVSGTTNIYRGISQTITADYNFGKATLSTLTYLISFDGNANVNWVPNSNNVGVFWGDNIKCQRYTYNTQNDAILIEVSAGDYSETGFSKTSYKLPNSYYYMYVDFTHSGISTGADESVTKDYSIRTSATQLSKINIINNCSVTDSNKYGIRGSGIKLINNSVDLTDPNNELEIIGTTDGYLFFGINFSEYKWTDGSAIDSSSKRTLKISTSRGNFNVDYYGYSKYGNNNWYWWYWAQDGGHDADQQEVQYSYKNVRLYDESLLTKVNLNDLLKFEVGWEYDENDDFQNWFGFVNNSTSDVYIDSFFMYDAYTNGNIAERKIDVIVPPNSTTRFYNPTTYLYRNKRGIGYKITLDWNGTTYYWPSFYNNQMNDAWGTNTTGLGYSTRLYDNWPMTQETWPNN